jgi:hypothetical protein
MGSRKLCILRSHFRRRFHNFWVSPFKKQSSSVAFAALTCTAFTGQNPLGLGGIRKPINAIRLYLVFSKTQVKSARSAVLRQC